MTTFKPGDKVYYLHSSGKKVCGIVAFPEDLARFWKREYNYVAQTGHLKTTIWSTWDRPMESHDYGYMFIDRVFHDGPQVINDKGTLWRCSRASGSYDIQITREELLEMSPVVRDDGTIIVFPDCAYREIGNG